MSTRRLLKTRHPLTPEEEESNSELEEEEDFDVSDVDDVSDDETFVVWQGKEITLPESGYYNLKTKRVVKNKPKDSVCSKHFNVCGSQDDITKFEKENGLRPAEEKVELMSKRRVTFGKDIIAEKEVVEKEVVENITWQNKEIALPSSGYYNLKTKRVVKNKPKDSVCSKVFNVCGSQDDIAEFEAENKGKKAKANEEKKESPKAIIKWEGRNISRLLDADKWYNLVTKRLVLRPPRGHVCISNPARVCGPQEIIDEFLNENEPPVPPRRKAVEEKKDPVKEAMYTLSLATSAITGAPTMMPKPTQNIVTEEAENVTEPNIRDIPYNEIKRVPIFNLEGFFTQAAVVNVIDGDTLDVAFYYFNQGYKNKGQGWILMRDNIRLYGLDAKETHGSTRQYGLEAKEKVKAKIESLGNYVYIDFIQYDKYGRSLAKIFEDKDAKKSINDWILTLKSSDGKPLAIPYFGGTKDEEFTKCPTK